LLPPSSAWKLFMYFLFPHSRCLRLHSAVFDHPDVRSIRWAISWNPHLLKKNSRSFCSVTLTVLPWQWSLVSVNFSMQVMSGPDIHKDKHGKRLYWDKRELDRTRSKSKQMNERNEKRFLPSLQRYAEQQRPSSTGNTLGWSHARFPSTMLCCTLDKAEEKVRGVQPALCSRNKRQYTIKRLRHWSSFLLPPTCLRIRAGRDAMVYTVSCQ